MLSKKIFIVLAGLFSGLMVFSQTKNTMVNIETGYGNIIIRLYDDTPLHRDNFIKLVNEGFYDNLLFHRVIANFMIQCGDPNSRNADKGEMLGTGGPGYTIPAELNTSHYHKKGALAAARRSDDVNPSKASSGSQFYIVQGTVFSQAQLDAYVRMDKHKTFSEEEIRDYTTIGGAPHLDGEYTVFGEVMEGLDVLDKIASVQVDGYSRPVEDIQMTMKILK